MRTASSCRRSPTSARRAGADARAAARLDGRRRARDASVQPPLDELARAGAGWRARRASAGWRAADGRQRPTRPSASALLSMLCLVVVFGVHSFVDWTWYVPGDACVALLCAGWLAGRGPLAPRDARAAAPPPRSRGAAGGASAARRRARRRGVERRTRGAGCGGARCASSARCVGIAVAVVIAARCSPPGRSGSRSARSTPPQQALALVARTRARRSSAPHAACRAIRCRCRRCSRSPRSSRPSAKRRRARDAAARGAPAASQPADVVHARPSTTCATEPAAALQRARSATIYLEPRGDLSAKRSRTATPNRSRSRTTTSEALRAISPQRRCTVAPAQAARARATLSAPAPRALAGRAQGAR